MLLTFEFKTIEEAKAFLDSLSAGQPAPAIPVAPGLPPVAGGLSKDPAPEVKKPKRKKAEPVIEPPVAGGQSNVTTEAAFSALETLINTKGYAAGRKVLQDLGAKRFPEVNPDQYPALVAVCQQA